jgi:PAS domain S-box-containing protein
VEGVFTLAHASRGYFTEDHLRLLNTVTQEISSTIHNAALYRYVQSQADRLGGLLEIQEKDASKTRAILESIADGVVFSDDKGHIVLTNAAATKILGVQAEQMHDRDIRDLVQLMDPEDQPTLQAALDGLMAGRDLDLRSVQTVRLTLQIGVLVANVHLSPVVAQMGGFLGVVMVFRDVTRETEVDRMKSEFISTVSHELRTPLTSIRGYVDLVLDGDAGEVTDETREYLEVVKGNSDRLTALINDLLDVSKIETGGRARYNLVPVAASPLAEQAVAQIHPRIEEKGLILQTHMPTDLPHIQADPEALSQVLDKLLSNAMKYTPSGGQITVTLSVREQDAVMQFDIEDTGIGISEDDVEKLFTRFFRAEHPDVEFAGGTGLGLSIAKSIVEGHGGEIWVTSPAPSGCGSVFSFTIPLATEVTPWIPATLPGLPRVQDTAGEPRRLLVVDDDRDVVRLLHHRLERDGYLVDTAVSGPEALARIAEVPPDLILLDVLMPEMDGYKVLEELKANPTTMDIPVVIISILQERERGQALGAIEYLTKPFNEQHLGKIIAEVLGCTGLVLIADDDPDIVSLLQRTLQRRGFATRIATDGLAALIQAQAEPLPDLILLDLRMPKLDGYQVLEQLRSDAATHSIPVVIITAATADQETKHRRTMELGATRFISKPIDLESLVVEVRQLVG